MKKKNIYLGLILILLSVFLMGSAMGLIPDIPWFKIFCLGALGSWGLRSLVDRDFFGVMMASGLLAWVFEDYLGIAELTPFPLLIAAAMTGIGLNMIFGKRHKAVEVNYYSDGETVKKTVEEARTENWTDGRHVELENNFNTTSKYVNASAFSTAKLENNFGSANIYFTNATVYNGEASIDLENNFGKMNVYLPSTWRASISQNSTFGHVGIFGEPNRDMDAPLVVVEAETNFGELNIFFD